MHALSDAENSPTPYELAILWTAKEFVSVDPACPDLAGCNVVADQITACRTMETACRFTGLWPHVQSVVRWRVRSHRSGRSDEGRFVAESAWLPACPRIVPKRW